MASRISFDQATRTLLDAAVDPTRWTAAMEAVTSYSGATGAVLFPVKGRGPGTPHSRSLQEGLDVYFRDSWHLRDERNRGLPLIRRQGIFVDQDFATREELATSDYYRGFLAKFDLNWSAVVGFNDPDDEWCLVFERGDKQGPFSKHEQADLVRFGAYLSQAAALSRSLAFSNATAALDAYQSVGCASFLIDQFGRVIRHNKDAENLLGDGLRISKGILKCTNPADNAGLDNLIASRHDALNSVCHHDQIALAHRKSKWPLIIRRVSLSGLAASLFSSAAALLIVSDTEKRSPPTAIETLRRVFGLTGMEAALVVKLEEEVPLSDAAQLLKISYETARTHVKHILSKTRTRRQQELLMLVRRLRT